MCAATAASAGRFTKTLDDGTAIIVDNYSNYSDSSLSSIILAADRSTQDDCPYSGTTYKGLFRAGDRLLIRQGYLAWFDYTTSDGVPFPPPFTSPANRGGILAGLWTLTGIDNPTLTTPQFKFFTTGPNGCWNWPRNQLIPGSASIPGVSQKHWWDKSSPPNEHGMRVVSTKGESILGTYQHGSQIPGGQWAPLYDGYKTSNDNVHYRTQARMTFRTNGEPMKLVTDISDLDDNNGVSAYIEAEVGYSCSPTSITVNWKFRPSSGSYKLENAYAKLWVAYAQDIDGTACDAGGAGEQWPNRVYGQPLWAKANHALKQSWSGSQFASYAIVPMTLGPKCPEPRVNNTITSVSWPTNGSYIQVSESSAMSSAKSGLRFTSVGVPGSGNGTQTTPYVLAMDRLTFSNETTDGMLNIGVVRSVSPTTLTGGQWYSVQWTVKPAFSGW